MIRSWEATAPHSLKSKPGDENLTIVLDAANVARLRVKHACEYICKVPFRATKLCVLQ